MQFQLDTGTMDSLVGTQAICGMEVLDTLYAFVMEGSWIGSGMEV